MAHLIWANNRLLTDNGEDVYFGPTFALQTFVPLVTKTWDIQISTI